MSSGKEQLPMIFIKHRDESGVTVDCPFCGAEHTHRTSGFNTALCGRGQYSAITPLPGRLA